MTGVGVDGRTVIALRRSNPPVIELNAAGAVLKMWGDAMFVWLYGFRRPPDGHLCSQAKDLRTG